MAGLVKKQLKEVHKLGRDVKTRNRKYGVITPDL